MRTALAWLYVPVVLLVLLALALGALYAAWPAIAVWYERDVLRGIPAGVVWATVLALAVAVFTTRRPA